MNEIVKLTSIEKYMMDVQCFPLLSRDDERSLAIQVWENKSIEAAEKLVTSNLRFVVKIAMEYRNYTTNLIDLIQEGNIGLMKAVKNFDPHKGYRLISYAVWWIRANIHSYLMKTYSMVKIGTTQAQRKLFTKLKSIQRKLTSHDGVGPEASEIARELDVREDEVIEMEMRMAGRDYSMDAEIDEGSSRSFIDVLPDEGNDQEEILAIKEEHSIVKQSVGKALTKLNPREQFIINKRIMADEPLTLEHIAKKYSISRERVRQIEQNAMKKVRGLLKEARVNSLPA